MTPEQIKQVAQAALPHAQSVAQHLLPSGRKNGNEWQCGDIRGERGKSFGVNLHTGTWNDLAVPDSGGGDLVSLWAASQELSQGKAAEEVAAFIGHQTNGRSQHITKPVNAKAAAEWLPIIPVPDDAPEPPLAKSNETRWRYEDAQGRLIQYQCRFDQSDSGKSFAALSYGRMNDSDKLEWRRKGVPAPRPLYKLAVITQNPQAVVVVCEGEKSVDAASQLLPLPHYICTTPMNGASAPNKTDWQPLKGREVIIWPDNDKAGEGFAQALQELLSDSKVSILDIASAFGDKPEKWDAADALAEDYTSEQLEQYVRAREGFLTECPKEEEKPKETKPSKPEKKRLALAEPEPWHEPVKGEELLDDIVGTVKRYLALPDGSAEAIALWCIFSHTIDAFYYSPRLFFSSPEKQCGKSTALKVIGRLVWRPWLVANVTGAVIFRTIESYRPTALLDESDTWMKDNEELRGILNSGHDRETAFIPRCEPNSHEPRMFSTWAAYAIAGIGRIPDTLEDRSVIVHMRRKRQNETLERYRPHRCDDLKTLARKIRRWADDNLEQLSCSYDPEIPKGLSDRAGDNWFPLLTIADHIGGEWPERARKAALDLYQHEQSEDVSLRVQLLMDLQALFEEKDTDRCFSKDICEWLAEQEDRPWAEWGYSSKPIQPSQLAKQLKPFGVKPKTIRCGFGDPAKGYYLDDLKESFSRYIPSQALQPLQTPKPTVEGDLDVTSSNSVLRQEPPKRYKNSEEKQSCNGYNGSEGGMVTPSSERMEIEL